MYDSLIFIVIIISFAYYFLIKSSNKKHKSRKKTSNSKNTHFLTRKKTDLMNGAGTSKDGGGIIKEKKKVTSIKNDKSKKPTSWKETSSYEEDIKSSSLEKSLINKDEHTILNSNSNPCILLIDDSMVVRKYVGDLLGKQMYNIILKNDGLEAINYLNTTHQKPDLIISDIEMPNMNGIQLIEAIRKEKKYKNIPILVISANAESHLTLMESEYIEGFIKKPFENSDLINQVSFLLKN